MSAGEKDYSGGICRRGFTDNPWRGEPLITRERVSMFAPLHRLTHPSYSNFYKERSISRSVRSSRIVNRTSLDKIRVTSKLYIYELESINSERGVYFDSSKSFENVCFLFGRNWTRQENKKIVRFVDRSICIGKFVSLDWNTRAS